MSRVSYQAMLDGAPGSDAFVPLPDAAFVTRRKHATTAITTAVSPEQRRFVRRAATAGGLDADAVVRAALDLVMALDVDWSTVGSVGELRRSLGEAVQVRRTR